jgi:hypothetical protein
MKLCSFLIDLRIPDDLSDAEQDRLLDLVDGLRLPYRLRCCVVATLERFVNRRQGLKVTVKN